MRSRNVLFAVAIVAASVAVGSYLLGRSYPAVSVTTVTRGPAVQAVYATGTVEPVIWTKVAPLATGRIAAIFLRDNAQVKEGMPLARLDDREARARLAELEARERYWRDEVQRQSTLAERGFAPREVRDRAQSEHLQAQAAVAAQRQRLQDLTLLAPMDGIILRQDGEVGEVVDAKQVLFWVGQPHPLRITSDVDEEDIPRVRVGQKTLIKADAFPGQVLEGAVAEITPKGDPLSKSFRVRVSLPDETPLRIGMTTEINIVTREAANALLVPAGALRNGQVFAVQDGAVRVRTVETGIEGQNMVEITAGLAEGDVVVVNPPSDLRDGQRVRPGSQPNGGAGPRT